MSVGIEAGAGAPKGGLAITIPDGVDPKAFKQQLQALGLLRRPGLSVRIRKAHGNAALLLGYKSDPRRIFELKPRKMPRGILSELVIDGPGLARGLVRMKPQIGPALGGALGELASVRARFSVGQQVLMSELLVDLSGGARARFTAPSKTRYSWTTPGLAYAASKGGRCLDRMTASMISGFKALAHAAPELKAPLLLRALSGVDRELACAAEDPLTRDDAVRLRTLVLLFRAVRLSAMFKRKEQLELLDQACKRGMQPACHRAREVRATPPVQLASAAGRCLPYRPDLFGRPDQEHFVVTSDGAARPGTGAGYPRQLVVDAAAPARAVVRALQRLTPKNGSAAWSVVFRGKRGLSAVEVFTARAPMRAQPLRLPDVSWEQVLPKIIAAACGPKHARVVLR